MKHFRIVELKENEFRIEKCIRFFYIPLYWDKFTVTEKGLPHTYTSLNLAKNDLNKLIIFYNKSEKIKVVYEI